MKRITNSMIALLAGALLIALTSPAFADDTEKTITGTGKCAKCDMHKTDKCENVVEITKKGKTIDYYLVDNDVTKDFHKNICKENKQVKVTGVIKKDSDGTLKMTASKIEVVADK